ncbi:hypothetical protein QN277_021613 [Acacia crassicarpa]|uniref:Rho-GAP domain-containing protein n=1 Tax=Acacia crassicarpa TaxID=499986 RepID=A0AAE1MPK9_9FABA|nr:hypothetical protein QN277_021613 [Acacia crassicarpa]
MTQQDRDHTNSLVPSLLSALRKSMVSCRMHPPDDVISAVPHDFETGWPTDVRHITHVTFDRFNGFLGLPADLQLEIPGRVPSASASVFGVSAESMQCSYDSKGNSIPTILLLMQERLYSHGGLEAEGIFRINPENSEEENVRGQLNRGIVPDDIDVHCLAGLIKAWFRELPSGILDGLSPEQVLQSNTEEEYVELVKQLKPTEAALLNWSVNLMADVVEHEEHNKMNARNIAMVFAPNMTQMSDPLTALMHAVQVMNFLMTLIMKTLTEREEAAGSPTSFHSSEDEYESEEEMDTSDGDEEAEEEAEPSLCEIEEYAMSYSESEARKSISSSSCEEQSVRSSVESSTSPSIKYPGNSNVEINTKLTDSLPGDTV